MKYQTGLIAQDYPDSRDWQLADYLMGEQPLPDVFDLRQQDTPIEHQRYGNCTSYSATDVKQFIDSQQYHRNINLSERFVYHNTKVLSNIWGLQADYLRNALKAIVKWGAPEQQLWDELPKPNLETYLKTTPPASVYEAAKKYQAKSYYRVNNDLNSIRQALYATKTPLSTGAMWYRAYNKPVLDGRLSLPNNHRVGGHAFSTVGWTQDKLWFRNSWGKTWGNNGYFYIPFEELSQHHFWDFWVLVDMPIEKPLIGYVAMDYLAPVIMKHDSVVETKNNLNVREMPAGKKVGMFKAGSEVVVLDDTPIRARFGNREYLWQKVKVVDNS